MPVADADPARRRRPVRDGTHGRSVRFRDTRRRALTGSALPLMGALVGQT
ncbi:hypothetical protein GZL_01995 [Streptomyces sp. 769]|nr:hypothetical protein GZL_01995 [Streptomyces sp. 769]